MSSTIKLNFINWSNDANNSDIVIFQKNEIPSYNETAVAWCVIHNCGRGDTHPFKYPLALSVATSDSYGNYTPKLDANPGDSFEVVLSPLGDELKPNGPATSVTEIDVQNNLERGAINACIYRDGRLLAIKTNVVPLQMATFALKPVIYIGPVSQIEEGDVMNEAILSEINTQISLLGIASADIVMTGGGVGPAAQPFQFTLQNVVMA